MDQAVMKRGGQCVRGSWLGTAAAVVLCCGARGMAPDEAAQVVRDAISTAGLAEADLGFKKDVVPDRNLSPMVRSLLGRPLGLFEFADRIEAEFSRPPWEGSAGGRARCEVRSWGGVQDPLRKPLQELLDTLLWHRRRVESLGRRVSPELRAASVRTVAVDTFPLEREPRSFARWAALTGDAGALRDLISRAGNLDIGPAEWIGLELEAGKPVALSEWRDELRGVLAAVSRFVAAAGAESTPKGRGSFGTFSVETSLGRVRLGGRGPDRHPAGCALVVDFGGDDTYEGAGESHGLAGLPLSVVIDLDGEDRYHNGGLGLWGVGVVWDERGDDHYAGGDGSLGCGLFGAGAVVDRSGRDDYDGGTLTQGAGLFGWGVLWDGSGGDEYAAAFQGQGFAGPNGCGALIDRGGDDVYKAGGKYPDYGRYPNNTMSLSQGFSIGCRPFAPGGLGVLLDGGGDDRYTCEVFGQGCGYWYSCGALIDADGRDTYEAHQYAQGSGIHLAIGLLRDRGGDDTYLTHHGLAQGGCHDFGTGLLWDGGGNDHYNAESGSQGCAIYNAVGMLVDEGGDDDYRLAAPGQGQGNGEWTERRGVGSVGVLVDLGGHDGYSTGIEGNAVRSRGDMGVAVDAASPAQLRAWGRPWAAAAGGGASTTGRRFDPTRVSSKNRPPPISSRAAEPRHDMLAFGSLVSARLPDPPVDRARILALGADPAIEELLLRAGRTGDAGWKIRDSGEATRRIEALPSARLGKLLPWVLRRDVGTRVLVENLVERRGRDCLPVLRSFAGSEWPDLRNLSIYWIGKNGGAKDAALAAKALPQERSAPVALLSLSRLGGTGFEDDVAPYLESGRGIERALAVRTLGRTPKPDYARIAGMLDDPDWNVRREAVEALSRGGRAAADCVGARRGRLGSLGRYWADKVGRGE